MTVNLRPGTLEYWAATRADEIAIVDGERTITWSEWDDASNRLANALAARGVGPGELIAIRSQTRHEWLFIHQAAAKLGCGIVPFNWRLTAAESRYVLQDSKATVLLLDDADPAALSESHEGLGLKAVIAFDANSSALPTLPALIADAQNTPLVSALPPSVVIYTSGTTGRPKGVAPDHATVTAEKTEFFASVAARTRQVPGAHVLLTLPMHHGAGPAACATMIRDGNLLVMIRRFDPEACLAAIEKHRISYWTAVPTMLKRIAALPPETLRKYDISSIITLRTGAAPVPPSLKEWARGYFGEKLGEGYGATEVGVISNIGPEDMRRKPASCGQPYKHVHIRVKNEDGSEVPRGQVGALWIKTPVTIRNYLNAPPLGPDVLDADGYFQVGDAGYIDEDGYVYLTDRVKDMIISGGVNIYPAEIEAALIQHPAVQDVAVIGVPDEEFGEAVKAFLEIKPGHEVPTPQALIDFSTPLLASYKRPRTVEIVAELPRNTMGKLLKRELRDPFWAGRDRSI